MYSKILVSFLFAFAIGTNAQKPVKLPKGFIKCKQNDPQFEQCVTQAGNYAIPHLAKGVREFGLPSIDPFVIPNLYVDQGNSQSVAIKLNFTNLSVIGLGNAVINNVKIDVQDKKVNLHLDIKKPLILDGTYTVTGRVLLLPITGSGHCKFVLHNFKAPVHMSANLISKHKLPYWDVDNLDFDFDVTKLEILLENLFNGDKALGNNMNLFLNENWREILTELKPAFRSAFAQVYISIVQRFFAQVPIEEVFPPQ